VLFEAGTFSVDAECVIVSEPAEGYIFGPYKIECRDIDGNELTTYEKPVTVTAKISEDQNINKVRIVGIDGEDQLPLETEVSEIDREVSAKIGQPMLVGGIVEKSGFNPLWPALGILLLIILLGGGSWLIRRRRSQSQAYDYVDDNYIGGGPDQSGGQGPTQSGGQGPTPGSGQGGGIGPVA
jgi:hypothetical protein